MTTYYKFTQNGGRPVYGKGNWSLPVDGKPGKWRKVSGDIIPCRSGLHASSVDHLPYWIGEELWEIEYADPPLECENKVVGRRARLVRRVTGWTCEAMRKFAASCATRAHEYAAAAAKDAKYAEYAAAAANTAANYAAEAAKYSANYDDANYVADAANCAAANAADAANYAAGANYAAAAATAAGTSGAKNERKKQAEWLKTHLGIGEGNKAREETMTNKEDACEVGGTNYDR